MRKTEKTKQNKQTKKTLHSNELKHCVGHLPGRPVNYDLNVKQQVAKRSTEHRLLSLHTKQWQMNMQPNLQRERHRSNNLQLKWTAHGWLFSEYQWNYTEMWVWLEWAREQDLHVVSLCCWAHTGSKWGSRKVQQAFSDYIFAKWDLRVYGWMHSTTESPVEEGGNAHKRWISFFHSISLALSHC